MRKLSCKFPCALTIGLFCPPIFYVYFHFGKPEIFSSTEFVDKILAAAFGTIIVWGVYGVSCVCSKSWLTCKDCKFSEIVPGSKKLNCVAGLTPPDDYPCCKGEPKEVKDSEMAKDLS